MAGTLQSVGIGAIAGLALAVALLFYVGHEKKEAAKAATIECRAEVSKENRDAIDTNLDAREKLDEIRQNRPDDSYYSDRWLLGGA